MMHQKTFKSLVSSNYFHTNTFLKRLIAEIAADDAFFNALKSAAYASNRLEFKVKLRDVLTPLKKEISAKGYLIAQEGFQDVRINDVFANLNSESFMPLWKEELNSIGYQVSYSDDTYIEFDEDVTITANLPNNSETTALLKNSIVDRKKFYSEVVRQILKHPMFVSDFLGVAAKQYIAGYNYLVLEDVINKEHYNEILYAIQKLPQHSKMAWVGGLPSLQELVSEIYADTWINVFQQYGYMTVIDVASSKITVRWEISPIYNIMYTDEHNKYYTSSAAIAPGNPIFGHAIQVYTRETPTFSLKEPTMKPGYIFDRWKDLDDGTEDKVIEIPRGSYGDRNFMVVIKTEEFKITYNSNIEPGSYAGQTDWDMWLKTKGKDTYTVDDADYTLPGLCKRPGYPKHEWSPASKIPRGSIGNKVFNAVWGDAYKFTLKINTGNPETSESHPAVTIESRIPLPPPSPPSSNHTLDRWDYANCDLKGKFIVGIWGDATCTAKFTRIPYRVSFDTAGGTPAIEPITVDSGTAIGESKFPKNPTKTDYTFAGWFSGGTEYTAATKIDGNVTLTAKWEAVPQPTVP